MKHMLARSVSRKMRYNADLCIPGIVDCEAGVYNIIKGWDEEGGFLSDVHHDIEQDKSWNKDINQGINVTILPFKKTDIKADELNKDEFIISNKNRILEFVHNDKFDDKNKRINNTRQEIIKQFGGVTFKVKSLELLRSRKELKPLLRALQTDDSIFRLIAVFIELKWVGEKHKISLKPRRNDTNEESIMLTLFVSKLSQNNTDKNKNKNDKNDDKKNQENEKQNAKCGLSLKCCLLTTRDVWVTQNYHTTAFKELYYELLHFTQFWLRFVPVITRYWCAKYSFNREVHHLPLLLPAKVMTFFWQKQFKIYQEDEENKNNNCLEYVHRKHYVLSCDLPVAVNQTKVNQYIHAPDPESCLEIEAKEEWKDSGIVSVDGIFTVNDITCIMNDIDQYLKNQDTIHFALAYKLHDSERDVIKKDNTLISAYVPYTYAQEEYQIWKNEEKEPYSESESDADSDNSMESHIIINNRSEHQNDHEIIDLTENNNNNNNNNNNCISNPYVDQNVMTTQQKYSPQANNAFMATHAIKQTNINSTFNDMNTNNINQTQTIGSNNYVPLPINSGNSYPTQPFNANTATQQMFNNTQNMSNNVISAYVMNNPFTTQPQIILNNLFKTYFMNNPSNTINTFSFQMAPNNPPNTINTFPFQMAPNTSTNNIFTPSIPFNSPTLHSTTNCINATPIIPIIYATNHSNINLRPVSEVNLVPIPPHFQQLIWPNYNTNNSTNSNYNNTKCHNKNTKIETKPVQIQQFHPKRFIVMKSNSKKKKKIQKNKPNKFEEFPRKTNNGVSTGANINVPNLYSLNTSKSMYLTSLRMGSIQHWKENLKRTVYKYEQKAKDIREREETKLIINRLNARTVRLYMHQHPEMTDINITNRLPEFWTEIIKPKLLKFRMDKIAKYYQFAFLFESKQDTNSFTIDLDQLQCGNTLLHFQNSELTLMLFCQYPCVFYSENFALTIIPGRIYSFDYNSISDESITICNNQKKCYVFLLRTSPCINKKGYYCFDTNEIYNCFAPIKFNQLYPHVQMKQYDDNREFCESNVHQTEYNEMIDNDIDVGKYMVKRWKNYKVQKMDVDQKKQPKRKKE
eukprot:293379_1